MALRTSNASRAVEMEPLRVPQRVAVEDGRLLWAFERGGAKLVPVPRRLLERFLDLRWPSRANDIPGYPLRRYAALHAAAGPYVPSNVAAKYAPLEEGRVLDFARAFGVLAICEHAVPTTHAPLAAAHPKWAARPAYPEVTECLPLGAMNESFQTRMGFSDASASMQGLAGWEPVQYWRSSATMLHSLLVIGDALENAHPVPSWAVSEVTSWPPRVISEDPRSRAEALLGHRREVGDYLPPSLEEELQRRGAAWPYMIRPKDDWDWSTLTDLYRERYAGERASPEPEFGVSRRPLASWSTSHGTARFMFDRYVSGLLDLARPHLEFRSTRRRAAVLAVDGLFGALVQQLLLRLHGSSGFAVCSGCVGVYTPVKKPAPQTPNYCPDCRSNIASADRQRRWRAAHPDRQRRRGSA